MTPPPEPGKAKTGRPKKFLSKAVSVIMVTALFGWFYGLASPRAFPKNTEFGLAYGILHGAMMPMALPALVMGQNVEIYASNHPGRYYKIGYIAGINLCGLVFFGSMFFRPRPNAGNGEGERGE